MAIYARYSTDRQDARSIDDQVRRCRAFAEARALAVSGVFKDAAESHGLRQIASLLNEEGVPAPYDDAYRKQGGRG